MVEAGEDRPRQGGDEEGVQVAVVAVQGLVAGDKADVDEVLSLAKAVKEDVFVLIINLLRLSIDRHQPEFLRSFPEVQLQRAPFAEMEGQG